MDPPEGNRGFTRWHREETPGRKQLSYSSGFTEEGLMNAFVKMTGEELSKTKGRC